MLTHTTPAVRVLLLLALAAAALTWLLRPAEVPLQLPLVEGALYLTRDGRHVHALIDRGADVHWRWVVSGPDLVRADGTASVTSRDLVRRVSR